TGEGYIFPALPCVAYRDNRTNPYNALVKPYGRRLILDSEKNLIFQSAAIDEIVKKRFPNFNRTVEPHERAATLAFRSDYVQETLNLFSQVVSEIVNSRLVDPANLDLSSLPHTKFVTEKGQVIAESFGHLMAIAARYAAYVNRVDSSFLAPFRTANGALAQFLLEHHRRIDKTEDATAPFYEIPFDRGSIPASLSKEVENLYLLRELLLRAFGGVVSPLSEAARWHSDPEEFYLVDKISGDVIDTASSLASQVIEYYLLIDPSLKPREISQLLAAGITDPTPRHPEKVSASTEVDKIGKESNLYFVQTYGEPLALVDAPDRTLDSPKSETVTLPSDIKLDKFSSNPEILLRAFRHVCQTSFHGIPSDHRALAEIIVESHKGELRGRVIELFNTIYRKYLYYDKTLTPGQALFLASRMVTKPDIKRSPNAAIDNLPVPNQSVEAPRSQPKMERADSKTVNLPVVNFRHLTSPCELISRSEYRYADPNERVFAHPEMIDRLLESLPQSTADYFDSTPLKDEHDRYSQYLEDHICPVINNFHSILWDLVEKGIVEPNEKGFQESHTLKFVDSKG
ncbi:MAG: hypothetical protein KDD42_09960, partial [Bdellovibrionales bacterium]|nr:hypothetical protein [Bdellovibrionales bacterium]